MLACTAARASPAARTTERVAVAYPPSARVVCRGVPWAGPSEPVPDSDAGYRVLDVGAGSGIMACLLANLVQVAASCAGGGRGCVVAVEHVPSLAAQATRNVAAHHQHLLHEHGGWLELHCADGLHLASALPLHDHQYDRIHVGGALQTVPAWLVNMLKPGGRAVVPIGPTDSPQQLCTIDKDLVTGEVTVQQHRAVLFVPITSASKQQDRAEAWDEVVHRCKANAANFAAAATADDAAALPSKGQLPLDCDCFLDTNFFVATVGERFPINKHFNYYSEEDFRRENAEFLEAVGEEVGALVVQELTQEKARRANMDQAAEQRKRDIAQVYPDKGDPGVYDLRANVGAFLHTEFVELVDEARKVARTLGADAVQNGEGIQALRQRCPCLQEIEAGIYTFPVFKPELCERLKREIDIFSVRCENLLTRPNSMNRNGVLLDEAGFTPMFTDPLMTDFIRPLATLLLPLDGGPTLDHHRCFTVHYAALKDGVDRELKDHYDNAEVTLNVSLLHSNPPSASTPAAAAAAGAADNVGGGGDLLFFGHKFEHAPRRKVRVLHRPGVGILHNGAERHCAEPIRQGERTNLIVWCRSTAWRRQFGCTMCGLTTGLKY